MTLKQAYFCNKCNEMQQTDAQGNLPDNWALLEFILTRDRTKKIKLHICPACCVTLKIPQGKVVDEKTPEQQLLELIQTIATNA